MNTTQRYKLINGTFSASEAKRVLLSLVTSKIDFHNLEKLSSEERFGRDVAHSERRLIELRQLQDTFRSICQSAGDAGMDIQLNGWVEAEFVPAPKSK